MSEPMTVGELKARIINAAAPGDPTNCWCPICEKEDQPTGAVVVWYIRSNGKMLCTFGACQVCTEMVMEITEKLRGVISRQSELRLMARYPELVERYAVMETIPPMPSLEEEE